MTRRNFLLNAVKQKVREQLQMSLNSVKPAGRLSLFYKEWSMITHDPVILIYIKGYKIPSSRSPTQSIPPSIRKYSESEMAYFIEAIDNLLSLGAIPECVARSD